MSDKGEEGGHINRNLVRYQTLIHPQGHIFGKLQMKFDKMKEFLYYYPKGNATNVMKAYKKIKHFEISKRLQSLHHVHKTTKNLYPPSPLIIDSKYALKSNHKYSAFSLEQQKP